MDKISFQKQVFGIIQSLTGQENVITTNRYLAQYMGKDLNGGTFLSQLLYWSDRGSRKDGYIYKTYKEWEEELMISEHLIRKHKKDLEKKGVLHTKIKKANGNPTVHYKIDREAFVHSFLEFLRKETGEVKEGTLNNEGSLTEITAEITTETTIHAFAESEWLNRYQSIQKEYDRTPKLISNKNLEYIEREVEKLISQNVSLAVFSSCVREYFDELPSTNDGDMVSFIKAIPRVFRDMIDIAEFME